MATLSPERRYEFTRTQLAAHIDYDVACEIADSIYEGNGERLEKAIANEVPVDDQEKVRRILSRIDQVCNAGDE
jgi:hypothetical protein